jgi:large subunit ribosomal protein L23
MELTEIIRRGIITEKAVDLQDPPENQQRKKPPEQQTHQYVFEVALEANKIEIRKAVEALFGVTVLAVNTARMPGKSRTMRTRKGARQSVARPWKKAIVTIPVSDTIIELQP